MTAAGATIRLQAVVPINPWSGPDRHQPALSGPDPGIIAGASFEDETLMKADKVTIWSEEPAKRERPAGWVKGSTHNDHPGGGREAPLATSLLSAI